MLKDLGIKTLKNGNNYIAECEVLDTDTNTKYYVVTQFGNLFYKTFTSSYIDYVKNGKTGKNPKCIEGDIYLWYNPDANINETKFWNEYKATFDAAKKLEHKDYINHKYPHLKRPLGNIPYKIVNKRSKSVFGCGPLGEAYEIEFILTDENTHIFVYSDDAYGYFSIFKESVYDALEKEDFEPIEPIEEIDIFSKAKNSKYYDLYLEMEKFKDNY